MLLQIFYAIMMHTWIPVMMKEHRHCIRLHTLTTEPQCPQNAAATILSSYKHIHKYMQGSQLFVERRILSWTMEFACFCWISTFLLNVAEFGTGWSVIRGQIQHVLITCSGRRKLITIQGGPNYGATLHFCL